MVFIEILYAYITKLQAYIVILPPFFQSKSVDFGANAVYFIAAHAA